MAKLTDKQEVFCSELLIDFNASRAAIAAGYAEKSARVTGSRLLTRANIQNRIAELMQKRIDDIEIDSRHVLRRLVEIDRMDVGDIVNDDGTVKPISKWPLEWRRSISGFDVSEFKAGEDMVGVLKKIRMPDKLKNLELLGKHIDISAFMDRPKEEEQEEATPVQIYVGVQDARVKGREDD